MFEITRFRDVKGYKSVRQDKGKLQRVQVSEEFELNHNRDIEVQLYVKDTTRELKLDLDVLTANGIQGFRMTPVSPITTRRG